MYPLSASVVKLPDTLVIEVTDSNQGGVHVLQDGTYWVISSSGKILGTAQRSGQRCADPWH